MKAVLPATILLVALCGCVRGALEPVKPTPPPPLTGGYLLTVEASAVCQLTVSKYEWQVEGTASGVAAPGVGVRLTLPGGDSTVDVTLTYLSELAVGGGVNTRRAPFGEELMVTVSTSARGALSSQTPGGRGQVQDGTLNGVIGLSGPEDRTSDALGSCTAANHRWTLVPR